MAKKIPIEDIPSPGEQELLERIKRIPDVSVRAYAAFTYLMGNRVSEAMGGWMKKRIGTYTYTHPRTGRTSQQPIYEYDYTNLAYEPLRKWQIEVAKRMEDEWIIVRNVPTLKRRDHKYFYRDVYVNLEGPYERKFAEILLNYIVAYKPEERLWELRRADRKNKIKPFDRRYVWKIIKKYTGIPPHKLRGMRATKDATEYGMDALDLKTKYNWASADMAFHYAKKNPRDIMNKISKNIRRP